MNTTTKRWLAAIGTMILCCFFAWLGGYDFDHRGFFVAYGAGIILLIGSFAAAFPFKDRP